MAQGIDSTKTAARPSHESIESEHHEANGGNSKESEQHKIDQIGMESAKRGENRIHSNEEVTRKESIFSK